MSTQVKCSKCSQDLWIVNSIETIPTASREYFVEPCECQKQEVSPTATQIELEKKLEAERGWKENWKRQYEKWSDHCHAMDVEYSKISDDRDHWMEEYERVSNQYNKVNQKYEDLVVRNSSLVDRISDLNKEKKDLKKELAELKEQQKSEQQQEQGRIFSFCPFCGINMHFDYCLKSGDKYTIHCGTCDKHYEIKAK